MTEAAPKICGTCKIAGPEHNVLFCPVAEFFDLRHNIGMAGCRLEGEEACPAHSSADDAKRREEFSSFVKAGRELVRRVKPGITEYESEAIAAVERLLP